ncbi:MAG: hypothetical protein KatS3mg039_1381 [Candidatus Kapaibacterium sp.]|nr:MAG: hypothetical protein KatS3mg039_1381 [Candidatus Kapabacteria bacterium]
MKRPAVAAIEPFPLRSREHADGSRRLAREKVFQVLAAYEVAATDRTRHFEHIFFRLFADGEVPTIEPDRILRPEEIAEIESDVPIHWRQSDLDYAHRLLEEVLVLRPVCDEQIERHAINWEFERIAHLDRQIMRIAITEMLRFDDIPVKVSINEALELAKRYSTDKSNVFINGILDATAHDLAAAGMLTKPLDHIPTPS